MHPLNRRQFVRELSLTTIGASLLLAELPRARGAVAATRKMTINLVGGNIGVTANQLQAIDLAQRHGFESVGADGEYLASLSDQQAKDLLGDMKGKGVRFGAAGLSVDFRQDDQRFHDGLARFPRIAAGLQRANVDRVGTWITPCHATLTYFQNFKQHTARLRQIAAILKDHGARLGLEYVGTHTSRISRKFPFIHTMAETKELIAEIGTGNVGFVMDSWHWWQAGDTEADILTLKAEQVIAVDANDAPAGIPKDQHRDNQRELPCATGVIDIAAFLNALNKIGYDGPVRAEPFNQALNRLDNEPACAATVAALKKAFELIKAE
jgi:sugar phosphate isomerase/epimerase